MNATLGRNNDERERREGVSERERRERGPGRGKPLVLRRKNLNYFVTREYFSSSATNLSKIF